VSVNYNLRKFPFSQLVEAATGMNTRRKKSPIPLQSKKVVTEDNGKAEKEYKLMNTWEAEYIPKDLPFEDRKVKLASICSLSETPFPANSCTELVPMTIYEEFAVMAVWFVLFSLMLYGPFVVIWLLLHKVEVGLALVVAGVVITLLPAEFSDAICFSKIATLNLKYFSYRAVWKMTLPPDRPFIAVTPPHGLFPIGGILGIFAMPRFTGFFGHGIAATAVLMVPIFGNLLRYLGCIEATRENCSNYLARGASLGISSGGIAEIFETNTINAARRKETIILKSRGGICKLALQNGVDIVPGYLFGNSTGFSVAYDPWGFMQWLSRTLRVSLCFFYGRGFLPVPYRIPVLAVFDAPIRVERVENPSREQVQALLDELIERIRVLFDTHKACYGWEDVELVIK
jgi:1-acyl-sn-glycerol-3-phosphate acyltransferase